MRYRADIEETCFVVEVCGGPDGEGDTVYTVFALGFVWGAGGWDGVYWALGEVSGDFHGASCEDCHVQGKWFEDGDAFVEDILPCGLKMSIAVVVRSVLCNKLEFYKVCKQRK